MTEEVTSLFSPDSFTSGLIDDVDATITAATVEEYDYNGKATYGNVCAIKLTLQDDGGESNEQYFPLGPITDWLPTEDGKYFQPITGKAGINKNAGAARLLDAMIKKGFPKNKLGKDVNALVGYKFHWKQTSKGKNDEGQDKTILLPEKLLASPGDKKAGGKTAAKPAAKPAAAAPAASGNGEVPADIAAKAIELTTKALTEAGGALTLDEASGKVFKMAVVDKSIAKEARQKIVNLVQDTGWIEENSGPSTWAYDSEAGTIEGA